MKKLIIKIIIILVLYSCIETEPVSTIPEIKFLNFDLSYSANSLDTFLTGRLEFSFIDGDADFGMYNVPNPTDSSDIINYNLILIPFEKLGSSYFEIEHDSSKPLPYYTIFHDNKLDRVGQNKTIKGIIRVDILYSLIPEYDTLRYDFFIVDRAGNKSNIDSTTDIGFKGIILPRTAL